MPQKQQEQPVGIFEKPSNVINLVFFVARVVATCFTPVLRSGNGTHSFALGLPALIFMVGFSGFTNCPLILWYVPVWMVLVAFRRATADRTAHSQYCGRPWPLFFLPEKRARTLEPFLLFAAAVSVSQYSAGLADFLLFGAVALFIVFACEMVMVEAIKRHQRDAQIEMQTQSRWSRGGGW